MLEKYEQAFEKYITQKGKAVEFYKSKINELTLLLENPEAHHDFSKLEQDRAKCLTVVNSYFDELKLHLQKARQETEKYQ